jgi:hypothetical protein
VNKNSGDGVPVAGEGWWGPSRPLSHWQLLVLALSIVSRSAGDSVPVAGEGWRGPSCPVSQ